MYVYSLMAFTRSEMRDVLLSISSSSDATSSDAAMRTSAARAVLASIDPSICSNASGSTFLRARSAASCQRSVCPCARSRVSICSSRLLNGETVEWGRPNLLHEERLKLFNLRLLFRRKFERAQFLTRLLDPLQRIPELTGGAPRRRCRIVQLVRQASRQFSKRSQPLLLLLNSRAFTNSIGHHADQPAGQFRHILHKLREIAGRKSQSAAVSNGATRKSELGHPRKRQAATNSPASKVNTTALATQLAANVHLAFENHVHGIGWCVPCTMYNIARLEVQLLRMAQEPVHLVHRQFGKGRNFQ